MRHKVILRPFMLVIASLPSVHFYISRAMSSDNDSTYRPEDFTVHRFLNKGSNYSFIYDVSYKQNRFALKHVVVQSYDDLRNAQHERDILALIHSCKLKKNKLSVGGVGHCFLISLFGAFQTSPVDLYQLLTLAEGGDLFTQRIRRPKCKFTELEARFYLAELSCALSFLHITCHIIHRDIKSENILLDSDGHVMLADFNLAREVNRGVKYNSKELGGTYEYLAPESAPPKCISSFASDIYAVGMLALEMVNGTSRSIPSDATEPEIFEMIARGDRENCEGRVSEEFNRFVKCMCSLQPFGRPSSSDLKTLPFFGSSNHWCAIDWSAISNRQIAAPPLMSNDNSEDESNTEDRKSASVVWDSSGGQSFKGENLKHFYLKFRGAE